MPKQQVNRTREKNDPAAFSHKPMLDEDKNTKSQMEGPAAYAPHQGAQGAKKNTRKQCQPDGPSPAHNDMLERHGFPPQAIEDCDEPTRAKGGGDDLRGSDKKQSDLRDAGKGAYSLPPNGGDAAESTPHQDAQWGADVRGQPTMVQREDDTPKGLSRERSGPYDPRKGLKRPSARMNS